MPICETIQVAPSTYYAAKSRRPSARALLDAVLAPLLVALWVHNYSVYERGKLWMAARLAGIDAGRSRR